jgi:hypothetical protein
MIGSGSASGFFRGRICIRIKVVRIRNTVILYPGSDHMDLTIFYPGSGPYLKVGGKINLALNAGTRLNFSSFQCFGSETFQWVPDPDPTLKKFCCWICSLSWWNNILNPVLRSRIFLCGYIARKKFWNELKFQLMFKLFFSNASVRFLLLKIWTEWVINCYILCQFSIPKHV